MLTCKPADGLHDDSYCEGLELEYGSTMLFYLFVFTGESAFYLKDHNLWTRENKGIIFISKTKSSHVVTWIIELTVKTSQHMQNRLQCKDALVSLHNWCLMHKVHSSNTYVWKRSCCVNFTCFSLKSSKQKGSLKTSFQEFNVKFMIKDGTLEANAET